MVLSPASTSRSTFAANEKTSERHHHRRLSSAISPTKSGLVSTLARLPAAATRSAGAVINSSVVKGSLEDNEKACGSRIPLLGHSSTRIARTSIGASGAQRRVFLLLVPIITLRLLVLTRHSQKRGIEDPTMTTNAFLTSPSRGPSRVVRATQSCELCIVDRHNPLCEYGIDNIRQSRHFMGSGHRVRRFMEKALRGENVTIGVMGASDTAGHGLKNGLSWHERMTEQLQAHFPNLKVHVGAEAGMNSKLFAYCFDSVVPRDLDMYMVELDINNDAVSGTFVADDHLYRGLLGLPQEPAVIRVSVFALGFTELLRGFGSNIGTSAFFDIPVIGIRNWILPHIIKNPDQAELFFSKDWAGTTDLRHIGEESHRALGDMIALYLEEQKCEAERRQYLEIPDLSETICVRSRV